MSNTHFCKPKLTDLKLIRYISNILVWTILGLYLVFILTFKIPAVQQFFGRQLASMISEKLGTSVTIGSIDVGIPNNVRLYNVVIRDQKGCDMLHARRLSARVELLPFAQGKISIASIQLFGANANLYQLDSLSKPNFQFALDSLTSKDTTNTPPLDLRINSFIMRNSSFSYNRYDLPQTPGVFNTKHLQVSDLSAHVILKALTNDTININVKRLSFKEQSGLQIDKLVFHYTGGRSHSLLKGFNLQLPHTNVQLDDMEAHYVVNNNALVIPSIRYKGGIMSSSITLSDLACFIPSLKTFKSTLFISSNIEGKNDKLTLPNLVIGSTTGDIDLNIDGWIDHLSQREPSWQANINNLKLSDKTVNFISQNLKAQATDVPAVLARLGNVHFIGIIKGEGMGMIDFNSRMNSDVGDVAIQFDIDKQHVFHGNIETKNISLNRLLADDKFGQLATTIHVEGRLPEGSSPIVNAKGMVQHFDFNGYHYQNINVNGSASSTNIIGKLNIDDPNIGLCLEGNVDRGHRSIVNLTADVTHFSPQATHLSAQWGVAVFDAHISANFIASNINDAVGTIDISHFSMTSPQHSYRLDSLHIATGYDNDIHYVNLQSDFGQVDITGNFEYETLAQSFTNFLAATLPTLPGLPKVNPQTHNDFAVKAQINKSDWLQSLLQVPVDLKAPLMLQGIVNDQTRQIVLECDIPHFYYGDNGYKQGHISISSPQDSLRFDLRIAKLYDDAPSIEVHAFGKAADNNLHASMVWDNHQKEQTLKGQLNAIANFTTSLDGKQTALINIQPSIINMHDTEWIIDPAFITYSKNYLDISNFAVRHEQQHLIINGTASENTADTLSADLIDIDISYILQLVDFDAVDFNGYASGTAQLRGIFGTLQADARLGVRDFKFQHGRMGTLYAEVDWNEEEQQIDIHATADDGPDAKTYINGYVSPERNFIDLGIQADGSYLDFAHSFTESFLSHIDGHGNGELRIVGPLDAINLTGQLVLNGTAHVKTLGCTYEMRNDTLRMVPNEIMFVHCPIYDIHGNEGMLTGGIHHQDLTNMTYDIYVNSQQLMAYDFPDFGDQNFYGTVFVDGNAAIHGRDGEVTIQADVTPLSKSVFVYNASTPDIITDQEFIQWGTAGTTDSLLPKKNRHDHTAPDNFRSDLNMNIKVNATPDAAIRLLMDARTGDYITLRGTGDIHATYYNKGGFNMFGTYEVSEGTYNLTIQDIIRKDFTFREGGNIIFSGDPYNALLNLQAQYIVNGVSLSDLNIGQSFSNTVRVNCLMNITGQPSAPLIDFDLDIPNVNSNEKQMLRSMINGQEEMRQQVIYLLAVGRFYPQGANNAVEDESQRSNTSLAMQSLLSGTLSGQINSVLSQVINNSNWNFGANISTGDEGWNNAEYEGIINGRLLNNRLLINGQFGYRDKATTASPSFIGDFDIRYLLFPNGNLALKVYNQTNDRYFTRSSLNTQGIGLIMKKDFSSWRDLLNLKRKRKPANQKKQ